MKLQNYMRKILIFILDFEEVINSFTSKQYDFFLYYISSK